MTGVILTIAAIVVVIIIKDKEVIELQKWMQKIILW